MAAIQSELTVIVKAKDLCSYVMTATEKSPKRFRFTLVAKLQSYALNTIENLCRANEVYVKPGNAAAVERRLAYQRQALTELNLMVLNRKLNLLMRNVQNPVVAFCERVELMNLRRNIIYG